MSHHFRLRVYYEDTDLAGIVYHANYLKFMERGRSEAVRDAGVDQSAMRDTHGLVFAVRHIAIDYLAPARFGEDLDVITDISHLGAAVMDMTQQVRRGDQILTQADIKIACMDLGAKPRRIPAEIRAKLSSLSRSQG